MSKEKPFRITDETLKEVFQELKKKVSFFCQVHIDAEVPDVNEEEELEKFNPSMFKII